MSHAELRSLAHAKVNLTLEVLGRRPDGFHAIRSLMVPIALADRLTLSPRRRGLTIAVPGAPALENGDNLALRAATLFREHFGLDGLHIVLEKRIPLAAGLGGGSSDAAAVLRALARQRGVRPPLLHPLAEALGSDVPFFLRERPALATGRGETLTPAPALPVLHLLLVKPGFGISAAAAYREWSIAHPGLTLTHTGANTTSVPGWPARQGVSSVPGVGKRLVNDLQAGCGRLQPELHSLLRRLSGLGAAGVLMSGSGSTCFAIFASARALRDARRRFEPLSGETVFASRTLRSTPARSPRD